MAPKKTTRIYWRDRGGVARAYGDFRDLGGKREALVPPGKTRATSDPDVAAKLVADRVAELTRQDRENALLGLKGRKRLGPFAAEHLIWKAKTDVTEKTIATAERHLRLAVEILGADRWLDTIGVADIEALRDALAETTTKRKRPPSGGTLRHVLNDVSNMYRHAASKGMVGYNPVAAMMDKPSASTREARWLEVHDAALLLESARTWKPEHPDITTPDIYAIVATLLLTGGRRTEVLGLAVEDVSFDRGTVTFRPNEFRRLKTKTSHRTVPLWPQLHDVLRAHRFGREKPSGGLLFPSSRSGGIVTDIRKSLNRVAMRAGWARGEVTSKMLRHTFCAARLQTLDNGHPVSLYTVSREMGHGSTAMVQRVYAHLGNVRHRSEVVEYRVDQHREVLGDRLGVLA